MRAIVVMFVIFAMAGLLYLFDIVLVSVVFSLSGFGIKRSGIEQSSYG